MQQTLDGIVLRQYTVGKDRVLHILTAQHGVITAFASGATRPGSKLAASTELLCYCTFVLFRRGERSIVDVADTNRIFFGIREDIEKLGLASYMAQLADEVCPHDVPAPEHLRLLLNTLHYIEEGKRPLAQLKAMYELRLLTISGFMPDLVGCSVCGAFEAPRMDFAPAGGDLVCLNCAEAGNEPPGGLRVPLNPSVLTAMRHILYSEFDKLYAFRLTEDAAVQLGYAAEQYLRFQVDRRLPALEFYNSLKAFSIPAKDSNK